MEGTILDIPSIALSQSYNSRSGQPPFWETSQRFAPDIIRKVLAQGVRRDVLVNINFPNCRPEEVKGVTVAPLGRRRQERLHIDKRHDGRGNPYYWVAYSRQNAFQVDRGSDMEALDSNRIAITPLKIDITDQPTMVGLAELFAKGV
jgi:5'-nucleotidase